MAKKKNDDLMTLAAIGIGGFFLYQYLKPKAVAGSITMTSPTVYTASGGGTGANPAGTAFNQYTSKEYLSWLQESLNFLQGSNLQIDGVLGPLTRAAITKFQITWGLKPDGIPGPETDYYIHSALGAPGYIDQPYSA